MRHEDAFPYLRSQIDALRRHCKRIGADREICFWIGFHQLILPHLILTAKLAGQTSVCLYADELSLDDVEDPKIHGYLRTLRNQPCAYEVSSLQRGGRVSGVDLPDYWVLSWKSQN